MFTSMTMIVAMTTVASLSAGNETKPVQGRETTATQTTEFVGPIAPTPFKEPSEQDLQCFGDDTAVGNPPVCPIVFDGSQDTPMLEKPAEGGTKKTQKRVHRVRQAMIDLSDAIISPELRHHLRELTERVVETAQSMIDRFKDRHAKAMEVTIDEQSVAAQEKGDNIENSSKDAGPVCLCELEEPAEDTLLTAMGLKQKSLGSRKPTNR